MSDSKRQFIADCFGLAVHSPRMDQIMGILELEERDRKIYELSGKVATVDIAARMGMSERHVERIAKEQLEIRRAG